MPKLITEQLHDRVRRAGAAPLLTYYDLGSGERTELSGSTMANWVDKTCHLLVEEYLVSVGDVVELAVAQAAPGHWMTVCWELACWQVGAAVSVGSGRAAQLVVTGPTLEGADGAADVLACSLHPLGLGFATSLPPGVADYAEQVRGQPDVFSAAAQPGSAPAWMDAERELTQADLVRSTGLEPARRLVRPGTPWRTAEEAAVIPVISGGSAVIVVGSDEQRTRQIAVEERVAALAD